MKGKITYEGLKSKMRLYHLNNTGVGMIMGVSGETIRAMFFEKLYLKTDRWAKLCEYFKCGMNDLVEFHGFEIKPRYQKPFFVYYEPMLHGVSYEPLRILFENTYGDKWKTKLNDFFDKVKTPVQPRSDKEEHQKQFRKIAFGDENYVPKKEDGYGLTTVIRSKIRQDKPVMLKLIYNFCEVLGCTPDYIMSYN